MLHEKPTSDPTPAAQLYSPTPGKPVLHLGCGKHIWEGCLNVDVVPLPGVDAVVDLNRLPWPFATGMWTKVVAHHVLEHLDDIVGAMRELHRILAPGGVADIHVPHVAGWGAWNDLTHRHFFTRRSFLYFQADHDCNYYYDFAFASVRCRNVFGIGKSACLNSLLNPLLNNKLYDWLLWKVIPSAAIEITLVK